METKNNVQEVLDKLNKTSHLSKEEWLFLLRNQNDAAPSAKKMACDIRDKVYGKTVFVRGLIEFSNFCKNDCYYCGIRRSNKCADRYRLTKEDILECCKEGYSLGFRTFVLQGGEDMGISDAFLCEMIKSIKQAYPDCAVTLSVGEKKKETYEAYFNAGADRYLLRHETASKPHYEKLHPKELTLQNRMDCLKALKEIGFQVGCGMMVGSPYQTDEDLAEDMLFLQDFCPHMVGMGPFISHKDTPFCDYENGSVAQTLYLLSLTRIMLPKVLLPATTALGTLAEQGREEAVLCGANVVMPNLSPKSVREKYMLYDNKISTGDEAAESLNHLKERFSAIGYKVATDRGDYKNFIKF